MPSGLPRSGERVSGRPRLLFVVNADWFFVSHRLALARACIEAGFDVAVCAGETDRRAEIESAGVRFIPLPIDRGGTRPATELRTMAALLRVYARERPDLVHHVTIKPVMYGSLVARALGIRGIVNAVSGLGYAFIPRADDRIPHRALRRGLWVGYRVALDGPRTRVIFQNEDDRSMFVDRGLVAAGRTALIRGSGVDFAKFAPRPLPQGAFVALLPARLLSDKGIGEFAEAATRLRARWPLARFALLGRIDPGNPAAISEAKVARWVESGALEWWGECSHDAMPEALARAHVVVLPSYREGLPLALAEAAAIGRACITTDVPGCRDTVEAGVTGWLVPPRDARALEAALEEALRDREELSLRGRRAADLARARFGLPAVVGQTLAVYRALLEDQHRPG
jgi:glycosyltransferase involved in cell wall biosynthesis